MKAQLFRILGILAVTMTLGVTSVNAQQVVFLDFDTGTDGSIVYTASMRDDIEALMEGHYADFAVTFTQLLPGSGDFSTLFFNSGGAGGLAEKIDFRNVDPNDTAVINVDGFGLVTEADIISSSAIIGSHEMGHLLGLRHGDSYGPPGLGLATSGTPGVGGYTPSYPGPVAGDEFDDHVMSSPASVGSTLGDVLTPSWFSERSATKLSINEQGTVQIESGVLTPLSFDVLNVPNTIVSGDNAGEAFDIESFVAAGDIDPAGDQDRFSFSGLAGDLFAFEVISEAIDERVTTIDSQITIFDSGGDVVDYYASTAFNDDEFETTDSIIIDLVLPADDTYTIQVNPALVVDLGSYELLGYRFALENEPPVAEDDEYDAVEDAQLVVPAPGVLSNDSDADGDPLTAVEDSTTSNGTLVLNDDGSFTYDPNPNYCGADSFTYHANDGQDDSNIATVSIDVACVNDAPVAVDNNYTHDEDTQLSGNVITDDTGEGVDSDVDGDGLSIDSNTDVSHGTLVLNPDGSFTYDPNLNYCGPDSFTYVITDDPPATPPPMTSNTATVSITVTCVNDPPEVTSVVAGSQTSDYSDFIGTVLITVEDVDDTSTTLVESNEPPDSTVSLSLASTGCTVVITESPAEDGSICTWDYDGQVLDPGVNSHGIVFTPSDDDGTGTVTGLHTLNIVAEDAVAELDIINPIAVEVAEDGGNSGPFPLFFSAWEFQPDDPRDGTAEFGDMNKASGFITLAPVGPGGPLTFECTLVEPFPVYPAEGYGQVAIFRCDLDDIPVNTYELLAEVDGQSDTTVYYYGFDEGVLVIYDPSLGFTTGGGWFLWPGSEDPALTACGPDGYAGDRTNIGFNMKYNKGKKKKPQGNLLLMRHTVDDACVEAGNYKVKSNAIEGLSVGDGTDASGDYGWAVIIGKSTFREPGLDNEGNHTFTLYAEDHGDQGCNQDPADEFWIEVKDKDGNIVLEINGPDSDPAGPDAATDGDDEPIECGNIVVPHETKGKGKP